MTASKSLESGVAIRVRQLRKSFGSQVVLDGIDLDIQPGEIFVLMGPSGSGKSVLLRHLIGLESPILARFYSMTHASRTKAFATASAWPWCSKAGDCSIH